MKSAAKAVLASLIAGVGSIVTALGDNTISGQEWATAILATLVAFGAVYGVANSGSAKA